MYDTDRSGCITKEELASMLRVNSLPYSYSFFFLINVDVGSGVRQFWQITIFSYFYNIYIYIVHVLNKFIYQSLLLNINIYTFYNITLKIISRKSGMKLYEIVMDVFLASMQEWCWRGWEAFYISRIILLSFLYR